MARRVLPARRELRALIQPFRVLQVRRVTPARPARRAQQVLIRRFRGRLARQDLSARQALRELRALPARLVLQVTLAPQALLALILPSRVRLARLVPRDLLDLLELTLQFRAQRVRQALLARQVLRVLIPSFRARQARQVQ